MNPTEADAADPQESSRLRAWHSVGLTLAGVVLLVLVAGVFEAISLPSHPPALVGGQLGQAATTSVRLRAASEVLEPWLGVVALLAAVVLELPWHLTPTRPIDRTGVWRTTRSAVIAVTTVLALATSARIIDVLTGHVYSDGSVSASVALRLSAAAGLLATFRYRRRLCGRILRSRQSPAHPVAGGLGLTAPSGTVVPLGVHATW